MAITQSTLDRTQRQAISRFPRQREEERKGGGGKPSKPIPIIVKALPSKHTIAKRAIACEKKEEREREEGAALTR